MTHHQFKHWLAATDLTRLKLHRSTGVLSPVVRTHRMPARGTCSKVIATGRRRVAERTRTKHVWTALTSASYGIAVNIDGTIVARKIQAIGTEIKMTPTGLITMNRRPLGFAGLTNPGVRLVFDEIAAAVRAWVACSGIRQEPKALTLLSTRMREDKLVMDFKLGDREPRELTLMEWGLGRQYLERMGWEIPGAPLASPVADWVPSSEDP
jgi:hypothetical protein